MFLLKIPGGLFGAEVERNLLNVLELNSRFEQCDAIYRLVKLLSASNLHLSSSNISDVGFYFEGKCFW